MKKSSRVIKKSIVTFLLPAIVLLILAVIVVSVKYIGENRSRADFLSVVRVADTPITELISSRTVNLGGWVSTKDQGNQIAFEAQSKELRMTYVGKGDCYADYSLGSSMTNFALRGMFYDDMQNKGSLFALISPTNPVDSIGLGVNTLISSDKYVYRLNTFGSTKASHVSRSLGWHLFEIFVTERGTFFKIDGSFVYQPQGNNTNLVINPSIQSSAKIRLVSSWKIVGAGGTTVSRYKDIVLVHQDNQSPEVQLLRGLGYFYNNYRDVNFVYPKATEINHLSYRLLFNTIQAFQTYGVKTSNQAAINQSRKLMSNFLNTDDQRWLTEHEDAGDIWAKANQINTFAAALYGMKNDLDKGSLEKGRLMLADQLKYYVWLSSDFEETDPLSNWTPFAGSSLEDVRVVDRGGDQGGKPNRVISLNNVASQKSIFIKHDFNPKWTKTDHDHYFHPIRAKVRFFDDGDSSLGTMFGLYKTDSQDSVGVGVHTGISPDKYVIRSGNSATMRPSNVSRTPGWHDFELVTEIGLDNVQGIAIYIDNQLVGKATNQYFSQSVYLISTWNLPGNAVYDDLAVTRIPASKYLNDSAAEENSWDASALAAVANYFPEVILAKDKQLVDDLIRCYAYHSLTIGTEPEYCKLRTRTLSSNYEIANHGLTPNPLYHFSTLGQIVGAMNSYRVVGKAVPLEFEHNYKEVFDSAMNYFDVNTCLFKGTENITKDLWSGATATPFQYGAGVLLFAQEKGWLSQELVNKCFNMRNMYFYGVANNFRRTSAVEHPLMKDKINPPPNDTFTMFQLDWKLDSILAGEANVGAALKAIP